MAEVAPAAAAVEEGVPNKRPRLWEQHQQHEPQQQQAGHGHRGHDGWEEHGDGEEGDSTGCVCSNAGCPWSFRSRRASSSTSRAGGSTNDPLLPPSDVEPQEGRVPPRQFFDGPLLSVKEYRDKPTGEVRCGACDACGGAVLPCLFQFFATCMCPSRVPRAAERYQRRTRISVCVRLFNRRGCCVCLVFRRSSPVLCVCV